MKDELMVRVLETKEAKLKKNSPVYDIDFRGKLLLFKKRKT